MDMKAEFDGGLVKVSRFSEKGYHVRENAPVYFRLLWSCF